MDLLELILSFLMGASYAFSDVKPIYSKIQNQELRQNLSKSNLKEIFRKKGLDESVSLFFKITEDFANKTKKLKSNKKGFKLHAESDKNLLIYIVKMAQYFADEIDGSSMHYYGLSLLYKEIPKDFDWAIENASLSSSEKLLMKDNLNAQLSGDN